MIWISNKAKVGLGSISLALYLKHSRQSFNEFKENEKSYDILIVGGGIAGTSLAIHLQKENIAAHKISVALLEKSSCGCEASGLSAGTLWNPSHGKISLSLKACETEIDPKAELCAYSMDFYEYVQQSGHDSGLIKSGNLILARNGKEAFHIATQHENLQQKGYNSQFLSNQNDIIAVEEALKGGDYIAALYTPESGYIEPLLATQAAKELAVDMGVKVFENTNALSINKQPTTRITTSGPISKQRRYSIETNTGFVFADHVVIAAGIHCKRLLHHFDVTVPVYRVKGTMYETQPFDSSTTLAVNKTSKLLKNTIYVAESDYTWHKMYTDKLHTPHASVIHIPPFITHDEFGVRQVRHCYMRPTMNGSVVVGGSRVLLSDEKEDFTIVDAHVNEIASHVKEFYPSCLTPHGMWSGVMPFSHDGRPLAGSLGKLDESLKGLWILGGFGPSGMMTAPGVSFFIADQIIKDIAQEKQDTSIVSSASFARNSHNSKALQERVLKFVDPCRKGGLKLEAST